METAEVDSSVDLWPIRPEDQSPLLNGLGSAESTRSTTSTTAPPAESETLNLREYKVLSRLHELISGDGFQPEQLEFALNSYAAQGWSLHSILTIHLGAAKTEEVLAILERPV